MAGGGRVFCQLAGDVRGGAGLAGA